MYKGYEYREDIPLPKGFDHAAQPEENQRHASRRSRFRTRVVAALLAFEHGSGQIYIPKEKEPHFGGSIQGLAG